MGHVISINSRKFLGSEFYAHNQYGKHELLKDVSSVMTMTILFPVLCVMSNGSIPLLMATVSLILGVSAGLIIYYFFPFKIMSFVRAGIVYKVSPDKDIEMRNAA